MFIRIGYEFGFSLPSPAAMLLMLYVHPSRASSLVRPERVRTEPSLPVREFIDTFGNRCGLIAAPAGELRIWSDAVVRDTGLPDRVAPQARALDVQDLPAEVIPYLLGSRYCEVDLLSQTAWDLFGQVPAGWSRVQAVCDWVHAHVRFGYEHARATRTATEVLREGVGVCRDFQHLAVTFCRCLNIPARYVTGYLGDIGVPPQPSDMDFSAWFEAFLDGQWWTFDARHNTSRIGRVLMACGRDATDVALTTSFGPHTLERFRVWTDELGDPNDLPAVPDEVPEPEEQRV